MNLNQKILILFLLVLTSCDKQLDLAPENTLVETDVFSSETTADAAVLDSYNSFYEAATFFGISYAYGDITTFNVGLPPNSAYQNYIDGNLAPDDFIVGEIWKNHYEAINIANNLIKKIPEIGTYDETLERQHVAEGLFVRAFAYLRLLQIYGDGALSGKTDGLGVVLQLSPFEGIIEDPKSRSSNGTVYSQIVEDLESAIPDLPISYETNEQTRSRATQGSARALLSRVHLYLNNYAVAAEMAQKVILDAGTYNLSADLMQLFPPNPNTSPQNMSNEWIFGFPASSNNGNFQFGTNGLSFYYSKTNAWANSDFIEIYDTLDLRRMELIHEGFTGRPNLTTFKFNNGEGHDNVPMLRLAEVILTRAECLTRISGVSQEAVDLLNTIRLRAWKTAVPYEVSDFSNAEELIDIILLERRLELAFEGLHRYDLIRTNRALRNPNVPEDRFAFPIPQYEIELSGGVVEQNPGY